MVTPATLTRRAELYYQIGNSISAGLPLAKALEMAGNNPSLQSSRALIHDLTQYLREGHTLADSFLLVQGKVPGREGMTFDNKKHKFWMPDFDVALLSVGEETGRLDSVFKMLAQFYADRAKIIRDTIADLILPMLNLSVFLLVFPLPYLVSFVVSGLMDGRWDQCIPFLVEKTVAYGLLYGSIFFLIFACQGTHGERWRGVVGGIVGLIPMLRTAVRFLVLGRFTAALEALVNAGVPVIRGWDMAARASGSPRLKREIEANIGQLEHGMTPAEMVNLTPYFPDMFRNLYYTGEISGQIDDTLIRLRDYYQEEGMRKLKLFTNIMTKVIYGVIALLIAIFIIRFYAGYFGGVAQQIDNFQ